MEALAKKMALPAYAEKTPDSVKADDLDKKGERVPPFFAWLLFGWFVNGDRRG